MLNPLNLFSKFIKSSNQRELDRIGKIVEKVNFLEANYKALNDQDFPKITSKIYLTNSNAPRSGAFGYIFYICDVILGNFENDQNNISHVFFD